MGYLSENIFLLLLTILSHEKVKIPIPSNIKTCVSILSRLLEYIEFEPFIDKKYKLERIPKTFKYADSGKKTGNLLVCFP